MAGVLVGFNFNAISPFMGFDMGIKGMAVMVIGGLGSIYGAMAGGMILGIAEVLSVAYLELIAARRLRIRADDFDSDHSTPRAFQHGDRDGTLTCWADIGNSVAIFMGINCLMGVSLYIPMTAGLISLGQGGFMAIGAICLRRPDQSGFSFRLALGAGGCAAAMAGALVGTPALRIRGIYVMILTLGFGEIVRVFFLEFRADRRRVGHGRHPPLTDAVASRDCERHRFSDGVAHPPVEARPRHGRHP